MSNAGQSWTDIQSEMDEQWFEQHHKAPEEKDVERLKAGLEKRGYLSVFVRQRGNMLNVWALSPASDILLEQVAADGIGRFLWSLPDHTRPPEKGPTVEQWAQVPCAYSWCVRR